MKTLAIIAMLLVAGCRTAGPVVIVRDSPGTTSTVSGTTVTAEQGKSTDAEVRP
jgi:hypothetical protein